MVVGDRGTVRDDRVGGGRLDLGPCATGFCSCLTARSHRRRYSRPVLSVYRRLRDPAGRRPRRARVFVVTAIGYVALIERRRQGLRYWAVPGGGIEPGESPEEAARREVHEELGLDVVLDREVDRQGSQVFYVAHVETELALRLGGPELLRNSSDNSYKPAWVPTEQASTLWLRPRGSASVLAQL